MILMNNLLKILSLHKMVIMIKDNILKLHIIL